MGGGAVSGDIDTAAILKRVNVVELDAKDLRKNLTDLQHKEEADIAELRLEMKGYTDKETASM